MGDKSKSESFRVSIRRALLRIPLVARRDDVTLGWLGAGGSASVGADPKADENNEVGS